MWVWVSGLEGTLLNVTFAADWFSVCCIRLGAGGAVGAGGKCHRS